MCVDDILKAFFVGTGGYEKGEQTSSNEVNGSNQANGGRGAGHGDADIIAESAGKEVGKCDCKHAKCIVSSTFASEIRQQLIAIDPYPVQRRQVFFCHLYFLPFFSGGLGGELD